MPVEERHEREGCVSLWHWGVPLSSVEQHVHVSRDLLGRYRFFCKVCIGCAPLDGGLVLAPGAEPCWGGGVDSWEAEKIREL